MLLLFLISSLFLNPGNEALPVFERGNPPSPSTLDTSTSKRSLYSIVWSCIVTTFLCAWVSLYPNTIHRLGGSWERAGQRVRLFLLTVMAPELVIGLAWLERRAVEKTKVEFWNNGIGISIRHAHFIEMGGFALCFPDDKVRAELRHEKHKVKAKNNNDEEATRDHDENAQVVTAHNEEPIPQVTRDVRDDHAMMKDEDVLVADDDLIRLRYIETLSAQRFLELLQSEPPLVKFPLITKCELDDRSKTDALAKIITAIQALWFIVQCIVRGAKGLVITEFELITLALASLNAFMLFLWRNKPHNVEVQIPVYLLKDSTESVKTWEENKKEWEKRKEALETEKSRENAEKDQAIWRKSLLFLWRFLLRRLWRLLFTMENWKKFRVGFLGLDQHEVKTSPETEEYQNVTAEDLQRALVAAARDPFRSITPPTADIDLTSCSGWGVFLLFFMVVISIFVLCITSLIYFIFAIAPSPFLFLLLKSRRVRNFYNAHLTRPRRGTFRYALLAGFIATVFGVLHLVALSRAFYFPTEAEGLLWFFMAFALTTIPILCALSALDNVLLSIRNQFLRRSPGLLARLPSFMVASLLEDQTVMIICSNNICISLLFIYTLARLCIIALTFAMLRSQPATAYLAVDWTEIFPHASSWDEPV